MTENVEQRERVFQKLREMEASLAGTPLVTDYWPDPLAAPVEPLPATEPPVEEVPDEPVAQEVDTRDLSTRAVENLRAMEASLQDNGVRFEPYAPRTQTWLGLLGLQDEPSKSAASPPPAREPLPTEPLGEQRPASEPPVVDGT